MSGSSPHRTPVPGSSGRRRSFGRSERRVYLVGVALSALLHLLLFLLARHITFTAAPGGYQPQDRDAEFDFGPRIIEYVLSPDAAPTVVVQPAQPAATPATPPEPDAAAPDPTPDATDLDEPAQPPAGPGGADVDAVDRLRPWAIDPRLWVRGRDMAPPDSSEFDQLRERLYATIRMLADSAMAADEAARRALDWTVRDSSGRRWGIAPDGIYVAGIRVPLPVRASTPPGRRDEFREWQRTWDEIQIQAELGAARAAREERAAAIRERVDAERRNSAPVAGPSNQQGEVRAERAASDGAGGS